NLTPEHKKRAETVRHHLLVIAFKGREAGGGTRQLHQFYLLWHTTRTAAVRVELAIGTRVGAIRSRKNNLAIPVRIPTATVISYVRVLTAGRTERNSIFHEYQW